MAFADYQPERTDIATADSGEKFSNIFVLSDYSYFITSVPVSSGDSYLAHYDAHGNKIWKKKVAFNPDCMNKCFALSRYDDIVIMLDNNNDENDGTLVEYDRAGNLVWRQKITEPSFSNVNFSTITVADDGYVMVGVAYNSYKQYYSLITKVNNNGVRVWSDVGKQAVGYRSVAVSSSGQIFVGGGDQYYYDREDSGASTSAILDKYSYDGKFLSSVAYKRDGWNTFERVIPMSDGRVLVLFDSLMDHGSTEEQKMLVESSDGGSFTDYFAAKGYSNAAKNVFGIVLHNNNFMLGSAGSVMNYDDYGNELWGAVPDSGEIFTSTTIDSSEDIVATTYKESDGSSKIASFSAPDSITNNTVSPVISYKISANRYPSDSQKEYEDTVRNANDALLVPTTKDRGFSFDGWYLDAEFTKKATESDIQDYIDNFDGSTSEYTGDNLTLYGRWNYRADVNLPIALAIIGGATVLIAVVSAIVAIKIKKNRKNKQTIVKDDPKQTDVVKDSEQTVAEVNIIQTDADKDHDSAKE